MEVKADETSKAIVPVLACVLNQLCLRNDRLPINQRNVSKFHALRPPAISIKDYLSRISKYAACSGECFVLALVYIDRIIQSNPTFVVNSLNIHRLLITSVMLAAKFFDDQYFNNAYYAKVGGVPCNEMNSLEVEFLFMTNFTLFVATDTYRQYYTELCNHASNSACGCSQMQIPKLVIPPGPNEQGVRTRMRSNSGQSASAAGAGGTGREVEGDEKMITDTPAIAGTGSQAPNASATATSAPAASASGSGSGAGGTVVVPAQPSLKQLAQQQQQMAAAGAAQQQQLAMQQQLAAQQYAAAQAQAQAAAAAQFKAQQQQQPQAPGGPRAGGGGAPTQYGFNPMYNPQGGQPQPKPVPQQHQGVQQMAYTHQHPQQQLYIPPYQGGGGGGVPMQHHQTLQQQQAAAAAASAMQQQQMQYHQAHAQSKPMGIKPNGGGGGAGMTDAAMVTGSPPVAPVS